MDDAFMRFQGLIKTLLFRHDGGVMIKKNDRYNWTNDEYIIIGDNTNAIMCTIVKKLIN